MNKPEWNEAPEWANFLVQDRLGHWIWFEIEPRVLNGEWQERGRPGKRCYAGQWMDSKEKRPDLQEYRKECFIVERIINGKLVKSAM